MNQGKVTQVIGPVLDIQFNKGEIPAIYNAVTVEVTDGTSITTE
jgi:F-type H+/Na+-transporting ATPase subunit beta